MDEQSARTTIDLDPVPGDLLGSQVAGQMGRLGTVGLIGPRVGPSGHPTSQQLAQAAKRALDVGGAACLLVLLAPLFLVIAALVSLDGGRVFYGHRRIGQGGRSFDCLKFRTMIPDAAECLTEYLSYHPQADDEWRRSLKLDRDPRVTPIGAFLRQWSLDELPQLVNVLRGEMSLVGPRPVTRPEMTHYGPVARLYTGVLPGMTGLWQVSGRSNLGYDSRVALDRAYIEGWSLRLDLRILLATPRAVLRRCGAK